MDWATNHPLPPDVSFDGGDLDCGNGLLLLIRRHIDPLEPGRLLEIRSTEPSVEEDLPAWARLTGNELVSRTRVGRVRSYLVRKGGAVGRAESSRPDGVSLSGLEDSARPTRAVPTIRPLSVMGIGSWPRPGWLLRALHDRLTGRLPEGEFETYADDAVRLAVA